ncbi:MAG: carbohydrate ABC transporter permease [Cytophagales bacterium]|nr:carbohydrate ABC transporter permease [Armatimonadota bacterium]
MQAFLWLLAVLVSLVSAVFVVGAVVAAVRARQPRLLALATTLLVVFAAVVLGARWPLVVLTVAVVTGFASRMLVRQASRNAQHALQTTKLTAAHMALLTGSFVFLIPFAWLISTSLKSDDEMSVFPPVWIPTQQIRLPEYKRPDGLNAGLSLFRPTDSPRTAPVRVAEIADLDTGEVRVRVLGDSPSGMSRELVVTRSELTKVRQTAPRWENYSEALDYLPPNTYHGLLFLGNTLLLTLLTTTGTVLSSSVVAYAFARLRWPGKNLWFGVLLATMMIPGAVTMMPQFLIFRSMGWYDSLRPLWVPAFFGSAFNIFLLRQFFMSIPGELEDAAKIDGCGPFGVYWRVMLPLVKPALAAIAIMSVLGAWNNFQGPLIYLSSPEKMPLAYALQLYQTQHSGEPGLLMAASTLVVLPIILLFFFTQRYFIEGVSLTGMGGR